MYFKLLDSILDILISMCKEASRGDKTMSYYLIFYYSTTFFYYSIRIEWLHKWLVEICHSLPT